VGGEVALGVTAIYQADAKGFEEVKDCANNWYCKAEAILGGLGEEIIYLSGEGERWTKFDAGIVVI